MMPSVISMATDTAVPIVVPPMVSIRMPGTRYARYADRPSPLPIPALMVSPKM